MLGKLHQIFCDYGPTPRLLLERLNPARTDIDPVAELDCYETKVHEKIIQLLRTDPNVAFTERYTSDDSHCVVLLRADPERMKIGYHISRHPVRCIISAHIGRKIGMLSAEGFSQQAQQMYNFLLGTDVTRSSAGWIFEGRVHACLRRGGIFDIKCLEAGGGGPLRFGTKVNELTFSSLGALNKLTREKKGSPEVNREIFGRYLRPERCNLTSIDSLCISETTAESGISQVFLFQITVGTEHAVKASGLKEVREHLPAHAQDRMPCIVFIVPESTCDFKKQAVTPVKENHPEAAWRQYVLKITDAKLWFLSKEQKRSVSDSNSAMTLQVPKRRMTVGEMPVDEPEEVDNPEEME